MGCHSSDKAGPDLSQFLVFFHDLHEKEKSEEHLQPHQPARECVPSQQDLVCSAPTMAMLREAQEIFLLPTRALQAVTNTSQLTLYNVSSFEQLAALAWSRTILTRAPLHSPSSQHDLKHCIIAVL